MAFRRVPPLLLVRPSACRRRSARRGSGEGSAVGLVAAFAIVLFRVTVVAADTAPTYVRGLNGDEWEASLLGYHAASLVITSTDGRLCTLLLAQIDWEATARRNGGPIDLLRLPEVDRSPAACEKPAPSPAASDLAPVQPPVAGVTDPGANGSVPYPPPGVERYRAIAVRASARPVLDGVLDDPGSDPEGICSAIGASDLDLAADLVGELTEYRGPDRWRRSPRRRADTPFVRQQRHVFGNRKARTSRSVTAR